MKTSDFEEQFTAWLDGRLAGDEGVAFEKELVSRGFDPATERRAVGQLGTLLRTHSPAPLLGNTEFFNHQLLHRIAQEQPAAATVVPEPRHGWWSLPRMVWAGAACLLLSGALFLAVIPHGNPVDRSDYFVQVLDSRPGDDSISADTVYTERDNVTVVWLDGLDYLPADYQLQ